MFAKRATHIRELTKVAFYVSLPIGSVYFLSQPEVMERVLKHKQYVVYPPEDPRIREEMAKVRVRIKEHKQDMIEKVRKHKEEQEVKNTPSSWKFW